MSGTRRFIVVSIFLLALLLISVQPGYAKEYTAYDEPDFQIDIGDCTWDGSKSMTSVTFTLTNTKAIVYMPSGDYFNLKMSRPVVTISLESGVYNYIWWDDYDPVFYVWLTQVEGSFTLDECRPQATASVSVGTCSWSESTGSITPVTINLDHAQLFLDGKVYTAPQTVITDLAPGTYTYSWEGINGYEGGESNLSLDIPDCTPEPAEVLIDIGGCEWTEMEGSLTSLQLTITGASLTINGPYGTYGPFTSNATLSLKEGHYTYSWTALSGYSGSDSGSFDLAGCEPQYGTASVTTGACVWDGLDSTFMAEITIDHAILSINGGTYEDEGTTLIQLDYGTYPYTWVAKPGFVGSGSGFITVEGCEPAAADVVTGACGWNGETSLTPVTITVHGATLLLYDTSSGSPVLHYTYGPGTYSIDLPMGTYDYTWSANVNFVGECSGSFETLDCEPGKADASINIGACTFDNDTSLTLVTINVNGAILTIDGQDYSEYAEIKLEPGDYPYTWVAKPGFEGSGDGTIHIEGCEPASVDVSLGVCDWVEETSMTPVTLTIHGATLTLSINNGGMLTLFGEYGPGTHIIDLPMGSYAYSWIANEDFTGSSDGSFETIDCEPGKADASIYIGACSYADGTSLSIISIYINGAVLTIDGQDFFENAELKLEPGDYPYSWAALEGFQGEGSGILSVGDCDPKSSEDPNPDFAAGGSGPSLLPSIAPFMLTSFSIGCTWWVLKRKTKQS